MSATWKQPKAAQIPAELIGNSEATRAVRELVGRVAPSNASVVLTGPSGSGKEVVAQLLHQSSPRTAMPLIAVNCAAIPRELLESELFGHEAGSFTGAVRAKRGRFEAADHGTLFLDEIGDMPGDMQVKLLRILETRIVERVGSMIGVPVDVRLIAATNTDLEAAIAAGRFREDLFYRLNVVEIRLTPLTERREDVPLLLEHFAATAATRGTGAGDVQFTAAATAWLSAQPWRGNVRELRNFVDRAAVLASGDSIDCELAARLLSTDRGHVAGRTVEQRLVDRPASSAVAIPPVALDRLQPGNVPSVRSEAAVASWPERSVERQSVDFWLQAPVTAAQDKHASAQTMGAPVDLKALLDHIEQSYIERALDCADGGIAQSARMLGLRRTTLIEKMKRLNIRRSGTPAAAAGSEQSENAALPDDNDIGPTAPSRSH